MNETTLFLAQLMGPVILLLGFSFGIKREAYIKWFKHIKKSQAELFLQGTIEAAVGLAIILKHNLWSTPTEALITLLGIATLLEGTFILLTKNMSIKKTVRHYANKEVMLTFMIGMIVLGGYLTWFGYFN